MMHDQNISTAQPTGLGPEADRLRAEIVARRRKLVEEECRLQAMALQLTALQRDIDDTQRGGVFGRFGRPKAGRETRIRELHATMNEARKKYAAATRAINSLQSEVAKLEKELAALQRDRLKRRSIAVESSNRAPAPPPMPGAESAAPEIPGEAVDRSVILNRIKLMQKAIDACDESRRDILSEIETVSTMGRCRVAQANGILNGIMDAGRDDAADDCAGRVSRSVERFLRIRREALVGDESPPDAIEFESVHLIERCMREFCGAWLRCDLTGNTPAMAVVDALMQAMMYLESRFRNLRDSR